MTHPNRSSRFKPAPRALALAALVALAAPAAAAELYRWVDENGVVNYSNTPPPKSAAGKPPTIVEDRVSVYTPERAVKEAIERDRERRAQAAPAASFTREPQRRVAAAAPPPPVAYDPCVNPADPACQTYLYDSSPVFHGRRRPPRLNQPDIPPGTIAGQAAGPNAYPPGLSGVTPAPPPRPRGAPGTGGFTVREPDPGTRR